MGDGMSGPDNPTEDDVILDAMFSDELAQRNLDVELIGGFDEEDEEEIPGIDEQRRMYAIDFAINISKNLGAPSIPVSSVIESAKKIEAFLKGEQ